MKNPNAQRKSLGYALLYKLLIERGHPSFVGDFEEIYREVMHQRGKARAWLWYWGQILRFLPPFILHVLYWRLAMIKNYIKIAFRTFLRHKSFSIINVSGLAVGMTCCVLILQFVRHELSYDQYHENMNRIYRITSHEIHEGNTRHLANTYSPLAPLLITDFPDIEYAVRFYPFSVAMEYDKEKCFQEERFFFTDSTVFDVFSFAFIRGNPKRALTEPNTVVLTEAMARKYFGDEDPLGKTLTVENKHDFKVTGVVQDTPPNSHFTFDFLASMTSVDHIVGTWVLDTNHGWYYPPMYTYILVPADFSVVRLKTQFPDFIRKHIGDWAVSERMFDIQPLTDIYLHSDLENEIEPTSNIVYMVILSTIAFLILLIACINFMNLATARSESRAKEVGLRKVMGARRDDLIRQFFGESMFFAVLAFLISVVLIHLFLPAFHQLVGKRIEIDFVKDWRMLLGLLFMTCFVGILSGSYPAVYLSRFRPVQVLKSKWSLVVKERPSFQPRAVLVVLQFIISIVLIVSTLIINQQLRFIQNTRLGFDKDHLVVIPVRDTEAQRDYERIKNEILSHPNVLQATVISNFPWDKGYHNFVFRAEGFRQDDVRRMPTLIVDHDFIHTFGMEILEGRDFSQDHTTDAQEAFILNSAAVKKLGWDSALQKRIEMRYVSEYGKIDGRVIGVVQDFHLRSLHHEIEPLIILISPASYYHKNLVVRIQSQQIPRTLAYLEDKWRGFVPHRPFEYFFLDEAFDKLYRKEEKMGRIFKSFSGIAILLGCLGLFGLASYTAERRTKEIGIRKVLGATVPSIILLVSGEFMKLVIVANLVAWPISYFAMRGWLANFAYHTRMGWMVFVLAGGCALLIAMMTVVTQALRAALTNPVDVMKVE